MNLVAHERPSSKVLLVDESHRVLRFSGIDRSTPEVPGRWFPVGGRIEHGETAQDAAIRETREETGLVIDNPGPIVFTRRFTWDFEGRRYDQEESYFLVSTPQFDRRDTSGRRPRGQRSENIAGGPSRSYEPIPTPCIPKVSQPSSSACCPHSRMSPQRPLTEGVASVTSASCRWPLEKIVPRILRS